MLFDTGLDRRVISDPKYWGSRITRGFMNRIFRFEMGPDDTLANQLRAADYEPNEPPERAALATEHSHA